MSLQDTPQSERIHIGFFGRRNAGKSSLINAIAGQPVSLVSETPGTTTDPVRKAMEILPLGPVLLIDTPGIDDKGSLGKMRVARSKEVIRETDIALLVLSAKVFLEENAAFLQRGFERSEPPVFRLLKALKREQFLLPERERALLADFREEDIPVMLIFSQADRLSEAEREALQIVIKILREEKTKYGISEVRSTSGLNLEGIEEIKSALGAFLPKQKERRLFSDLVEAGDYIVLVSPIDESAPKGRIILPQQMAIRDLLDYHAIPVVAQPEELKTIMESLEGKVKLVVTDSQAILMARYKGFLSYALEGCAVLDALEEGDKIYIAEGCTHHRQCGDIGTVKLPKMLEKYSGKKLDFVFTEGKGFLSEEKQKELKLMIHCGACMLSEREVQSRYRDFLDKGIPICNYGLAMAKMNGILDRAVAML